MCGSTSSAKGAYGIHGRHVLLRHDACFWVPEQLNNAQGLPFDVRHIWVLARQPALFWLDAHWSGRVTARGKDDSPIIPELRAILRSAPSGSVILIDARCLEGRGGYPTVPDLWQLIANSRNSFELTLETDIIRI